MTYVVINGGKKLHGRLPAHANKNSALSILSAALMIPGKTTLVDVPAIEDVERMIELIESLGCVVERPAPGAVSIDATRISTSKLNQAAAQKMRASVLLWGALASRVTSYKMYRQEGCSLGERTVRPHMYALEKLGVHVVAHEGYYATRNDSSRRASQIVMYESGDTTTENAIMAAVVASGVTTIKMASANYMVQDLCYFLTQAGAQIAGIGTTTLTITGVKELRPVENYPIMPDPIVAMTFLSAAIATRSAVTVENCALEFLELELCKLDVMGQKYQIRNKRKSKNGFFEIGDIAVVPSKLTALPDKIDGRPFPGLNIDNLPLFIPILTQATGRTLVHDWAYENRAVYALDLQKLGAKITLLDPHRLWVEGPTKLTANELICPSALRPAVNVLICMLAASGKSVLRNTYVIDRGYEDIYEVLNRAGAEIEVVKE